MSTKSKSKPKSTEPAHDTREDAFLTLAEPELGLRPFSIGTFNMCRKMGLTLFTGGKATEKSLDPLEQLVALAWLQSQPLPEVLRALREKTWQSEVELWQFELPPSTLNQLTAEVKRMGEQASAAVVDVEKQPTAPGGSTPKPRGKSSRPAGRPAS
jgi:hypothetical protein